MPFTPYHIGPGIFIKSLLRTRFSLFIFGWTQILMDVQALLFIFIGFGSLHGISHTYIGAIFISIISVISGKFLINLINYYNNEIKIMSPSFQVIYISAFIGSFSHIILDSIMHADMQPFYPFFIDNNILRLISINQLHEFCIYSGVVGLFIIFCLKKMLRFK